MTHQRKLKSSIRKLVKKNYKIDQEKRLELLSRIVTEFPKFVDAHTEKAFVLYNFGELNQARSALEDRHCSQARIPSQTTLNPSQLLQGTSRL